MQLCSLGTSASRGRATIACRPKCPPPYKRRAHLVHTRRNACDDAGERSRRWTSKDESVPWTRPNTAPGPESWTPVRSSLGSRTRGNGRGRRNSLQPRAYREQNYRPHKEESNLSRDFDSRYSPSSLPPDSRVQKRRPSAVLPRDYFAALQGFSTHENQDFSTHEDENDPQRAELLVRLWCDGRKNGQHPETDVLIEDADKVEQSLYPMTRIHPHWVRNIRTLRNYKGSDLPAREIWRQLIVDRWDTSAAWVTRITERGHRLSDYFLAWQTVPMEERANRWPDIALWLLLNSPEQALLFLRATDRTPGPSFRMVSDCFWYLYVTHRGLFEASEKSKAQFYRYLSFCVGPSRWPAVAPSMRGLRLYVQTRKDKELARPFERLIKLGVSASNRVWLDFVDSFVRIGDVCNAVRALEKIFKSSEGRSPIIDARIRTYCCMILRWDSIAETENGRVFRILNDLLAMGVKLDQGMYNVAISNALRLKEFQLAWDIMEHMCSSPNVPRPDSYTYLLLLDDAVERLDFGKIERTLELVSRVPHLRSQRHILSKTLQSIYKSSMKDPSTGWVTPSVFDLMTSLYCEAHDATPLVDLGIIARDYESPTDVEKEPPSVHSLTIMISAFLTQAKPAVIRETFQRFCQLVLAGDKNVAPLAETDHVYNQFLFKMMFHIRLLNDSIKVVETMQNPFPHPVVVDGDPPRSIQNASPTIRTWTILLQTFLRHQQPKTALKIRELMLKHDQEFNDVTYKVMLKGLATMQLVDETAAVFYLMFTGPYKPDEDILAIVAKIEDQRRFRKVLRMLDETGLPGNEDHHTLDPDPSVQPTPDSANIETELEG